MARKATRNAQGAGTIRQRKDGRWEGRYTMGRDPKISTVKKAADALGIDIKELLEG